MTFGSVCSGIEAASVAWKPLGWEARFLAEIDPACRSVLAHHYPETKLYGDFTTITADAGPIDVLVGGTPCQSFSIAGLRGGLDDDRGNLALEFCRLADRLRPRWFVWENVPGVLSSNGGRDFGSILGAMGELGYGTAYRVLDARHFGVPQRRRRVFVVGHLGDWRRAAAVLFERHSLSGDTPPRREAGQGFTHDIAPSLTSSGRGVERGGDTRGQDPVVAILTGVVDERSKSLGAESISGYTAVAAGSNPAHSLTSSTGQTSHCLNAGGMGRIDYETETLVTHCAPVSPTLRAGKNETGGDRPPGTDVDTCETLIAFTCKDHGADAGDISPTLRSMGFDKSHANAGGQVAVATFDPRNVTSKANRTRVEFGAPANTLHEAGLSIIGSAVRRLTPLECARLQGFPDDYFAGVIQRGKPLADGPIYKMLGNSMAVPVVRWIGERIQAAEATA